MRKKFTSTLFSDHFRRERQLRNYAKNQAGIKENRKTKHSLKGLDFMPAGNRLQMYSNSFDYL